MKIPDKPSPGARMTAAWGCQVIDYLRSITPHSGQGILANQTANGITFNALPDVTWRGTTAKLKSDIAILAAELAAAVILLQLEIAAVAAAAAAALAAAVAALEAQIAALEAQVIALDAAVVILQGEVAALTIAVAALTAAVAALTARVTTLEGQVASLMAWRTALSAHVVITNEGFELPLATGIPGDDLRVTIEMCDGTTPVNKKALIWTA